MDEAGELLIEVLGIVCAIGLPLLLAIVATYMTISGRHKEKMAMIERGMRLEEAAGPERKPDRYKALRNGVCMVGLSMGVIVGMVVDSYVPSESDWYWLLVPAITVMFGGISFIVYFVLSRSLMEKERREDERRGDFTEF